MARTKTKTEEIKIEEVVAPLEIENVKPEAINITEAKPEPEPIKPKIIIAKTSVPFRSKPVLEWKYVTGQMPVGIAYEIVREVNSKIYGDFYLLNNGSYITKEGYYSIS